MFDGSWFNWRRLMTALQALRPTLVQARQPEQMVLLLRQVQAANSLRHLATVAALAHRLPWPQRRQRQQVLQAVAARLAQLPSRPASPRSSSSRTKRAKSTTRQRR